MFEELRSADSFHFAVAGYHDDGEVTDLKPLMASAARVIARLIEEAKTRETVE